jgi:hypothetical protein
MIGEVWHFSEKPGPNGILDTVREDWSRKWRNAP